MDAFRLPDKEAAAGRDCESCLPKRSNTVSVRVGQIIIHSVTIAVSFIEIKSETPDPLE